MKQEREKIKKALTKREIFMYQVLKANPELRGIRKTNILIRHVWMFWQNYDYGVRDMSASTILRAARSVRAQFLDTDENQEIRANLETAYREHFKQKLR